MSVSYYWDCIDTSSRSSLEMFPALWLYSVCSVQGGAHCEGEAALGLLCSCLVTKQGHSCNRKGAAAGQQHLEQHWDIWTSAALWLLCVTHVCHPQGSWHRFCLLSLSPRDQSSSSGVEEELWQGLVPLGKPQSVLEVGNWILSPPAEAFQAAQHPWLTSLEASDQNWEK